MPRRGRRARRDAATRRVVVATLAVLGCGGDTKPVEEKTAPAKTEVRTKAHADAFERLLPLAVDTLVLADPMGAAQIGKGSARMPPLGGGERVRLRESVDATWREAAEIDADTLGLERSVILRALRFGLLRVRDDLERRTLARTDPGLAIDAASRLVRELDVRAGRPLARDAEVALEHASAMLREGVQDLGATSPEALQGARDDLAALRTRVGDASPALSTAMTAVDARLTAVAAALGSAKTAAADERVARAREPGDVRKLAARLGASTLRRRLEVEESETQPAKDLFAELVATTRSLSAMRGDAPTKPGEARPVTAERCTSAWAKVQAYAREQPALQGAALECDAFVTAHAGETLDDAALVLAIVHDGVVEPTRRARRRAEIPALAIVGGRIAPASHVHAQTLAVVTGMADPDARALALDRALDATCLAATALFVHGELGGDTALAAALGDGCEQHATDAWIARALARPRASLDGLGLVLLGRGPADAVALERWWWLPIGLVIPTARPEPPRAPPTDAKVVVEPIVPGEPPR